MRNRSENKKWDGWRGMKRDEDFVQESKRMRQVEQDLRLLETFGQTGIQTETLITSNY